MNIQYVYLGKVYFLLHIMKKIFLLLVVLVTNWSLASAQLQIFPDDIDGSKENKEEVNAVVKSVLTGNG